MSFRTVEDIYWKVELLKYFEDSKCWNIRVLDYKVDDLSTFQKQKPTRAIEMVRFEKLDWILLEPQLSSYQIINLADLIYNYRPPNRNIYNPQESIKRSRYQKTQLLDYPNTKNNPKPVGPIIDHVNLRFSIGYKEAKFHNGFVSFERYVQKLRDKVEFRIQNEHIIEEFDNIKLWFSKKFKSKTFKVAVLITTIDDQISEINAKSSDIELITPELIDSVKYDRTIALTKPPKIRDENKSLFTLSDIFELVDTDLEKGNVFNQSEPEIIKSLTEYEYVRNRKYLEFLSEKKQSTKSKIYFTLSPLFGFVFLIEKGDKYHFAWELLKSHATYLWTIDKNSLRLDTQYSKIEKYIAETLTIGRGRYRREYLHKSTLDGFTFKAIEHQDILTMPEDGFDKWRNKLEDILNNE